MNSVKSTGNILSSVPFSPHEAEKPGLWVTMKENTVVVYFLLLVLSDMACYSRASPIYRKFIIFLCFYNKEHGRNRNHEVPIMQMHFHIFALRF